MPVFLLLASAQRGEGQGVCVRERAWVAIDERMGGGGLCWFVYTLVFTVS